MAGISSEDEARSPSLRLLTRLAHMSRFNEQSSGQLHPSVSTACSEWQEAIHLTDLACVAAHHRDKASLSGFSFVGAEFAVQPRHLPGWVPSALIR